MLKDEILGFVKRSRQVRECREFAESRRLPENCYYLDDGVVLCYPRTTGDSRYPYACDGFTLWAYSSGYFSLNESTYYYILPSEEGKQPYAAFFGGIEDGDGYTPISVTGAARQPKENATRFTVYTPTAAYYITEADDIVFFLRAFVSKDKKAVFTVGAINVGEDEKTPYLSTYLNCLCMHTTAECCETKWFKQCKATPYGFEFESIENLTRTLRLVNRGVIEREVHGNIVGESHTCSRSGFTGGMTTALNCSASLFTGEFENPSDICKFSDTATAGDIYKFSLSAGGIASIDYVLTSDNASYENGDDTTNLFPPVRPVSDDYARAALTALNNAVRRAADSDTAVKINFGEFEDGTLNGNVFTKFVKSVMNQVEFAALAKNSGASLLGVRDVFQQIEAALIWTGAACRKKIVEALSFTDPCGRPPRQYSIPQKGALPKLDTRAFIDQGVWIISTLYSYLAYTGDFKILSEQCGYCKFVGGSVEHTSERNSVFEHITRIADYLIDNIDEATGCVRALYGDWNDALDGLGVSADGKAEFGSGVSVMTTLQLYKNLEELIEILDAYGDRYDKRERYINARSKIEKGVFENAIAKHGGARRILHGWGDGKSYEVGGFCDVDSKSRDSLTANAFFVISGAYLIDKSLKCDIIKALDRLDAKYGLKTFEPYFEKNARGVGRIVDLPKGTAENAATYVHAAMFGVWALFLLGESKAAWQQLYKVLPLTHDRITTTPFVMSNSYSLNTELGLDGESMSDWFTGSANALIKATVRYVFGIQPDLHGVKVCPAKYMPFTNADITLSVKGKRLSVRLRKANGGKKSVFTLNGKTLDPMTDASTDSPCVYIDDGDLQPDNVIVVQA